MPDDAPSTGGWLPPAAPGGNPPPRFDAPGWTAPRPADPPVREQPAAEAERARHADGRARQRRPRRTRPRFDAPRQQSNATAVWALVLGVRRPDAAADLVRARSSS